MAAKPDALTHVDARGRVRMVDVGAKPETAREAVAEADVRMSAAARRAIRTRAVAKGDPLQTARIAGIQAAKRTSDLIPLCHPLPLTRVDVDLVPRRDGYRVRARVATVARTGVEMEALVAVSIAALALYDMLKAIDRAMVIGPVQLVEKRGGRSGHFRRARTTRGRGGRDGRWWRMQGWGALPSGSFPCLQARRTGVHWWNRIFVRWPRRSCLNWFARRPCDIPWRCAG